MSVRLYTSPGNVIVPRPPVLRQHAPGRISRQDRYARSLSAPLMPEKDFSYCPWECGTRDFTLSLFGTSRRESSRPLNEINRGQYIYTPLGRKSSELRVPASESTRRDFINSLWETKPIPLSESKRTNFFKCPEIKQKVLTLPCLDSKRIEPTKSHLSNNERNSIKNRLDSNRIEPTKSHLSNNERNSIKNRLDSNRIELTKSHLSNNERNSIKNHLDINRRDFIHSCLDTNRRDLSNSHLESSRKHSSESCSEDTTGDLAHSHADSDTSNLFNGYLETKGNDCSTNQLETRSRTLPDRRRVIRWWNKEKNLCTPDELLEIIREPTGHYELPTDPCNEVYPGIILSDGPTALCTSMLKRMGVSHVLNAAQGKERPGQVNTNPGFYSHSRIRYLGVEAFDHIAFRLYPYFEEAADFIQEALDSGGKALVHCRAGISRSATLVCAFLMLKRHLSAQEAIRTVRKNRPIIPNDGFLQQLCDLNERLRKTRGP